MALRKFLILRKLQSSCLEGCTALIPAIVNFLTPSQGLSHRHRPEPILGPGQRPDLWAGVMGAGALDIVDQLLSSMSSQG